MKIAFHLMEHQESTHKFYQYTIDKLRQGGDEVFVTSKLSELVGYDLVYSHHKIFKKPFEHILNYKNNTKIFSGLTLTRKQTMQLTEEYEVPAAPWFCPDKFEHVQYLFDLWGDIIVYKRSFTGGGFGVHVLRRHYPEDPCDYEIRLHPSMINGNDIFCQLIDNPQLYKIEMFNGVKIHAWTTVRGDIFKPAFPRVKSERFVWEPSDDILKPLINLSKALTKKGCTYTSFDFMMHKGDIKLIEFNPCNVATWWIAEQPGAKERMYEAFMSVLKEGVVPAHDPLLMDRAVFSKSYKSII